MPFVASKNGMRMYQPNWQSQPGSRMKAMNRAASDNYFASASTLGGNLLGAAISQSSGMIELTSKITTARLQGDYQKKLAQAKAGLDVLI